MTDLFNESLVKKIQDAIDHHLTDSDQETNNTTHLIASFIEQLSQLKQTQDDIQSIVDLIINQLPKCLETLSQKHHQHSVKNQFIYVYFAQFLQDALSVKWDKIQPLQSDDAIPFETLSSEKTYYQLGTDNLKQCAVIKLNGGLGTSMGCVGPKSGIRIFDEHTFLDIIAKQIDQYRQSTNTDIPLLFMNSFNTTEETKAILEGKIDYQEFLQHQFPKLTPEYGPFENPEDTNQEWNPPGHGDIYLSLYVSGQLDRLLDSGIEYAFISNSDNLGASLDPNILGYMISTQKEFLMETTPKTLSDVKGGTLVRYEGQLMLLERAQVPEENLSDFEDIKTFTVFNTNNIWVNLRALKEKITTNALQLPVIINKKKVNERPVIQLETAMGAAIGQFSNSGSVIVPRHRFLPVKKTSDLLILQSDLVDKSDICDLKYHENCQKNGIPKIQFEGPLTQIEHYEKAMQVVPSLKTLKELTVKGAISFLEPQELSGSVTLES